MKLSWPTKKTALVLSGGANRGALQVGAMRALFERGFRPDILVGASAGALNAAYLAADPTAQQVEKLTEIWQSCSKEDIYPGTNYQMAWRVLRGAPSLYPSDGLRDFIGRNHPAEFPRFGDLTAASLYVVAAHQANNDIRVFGDDPQETILDALLASAAIPPLLPPHRYKDEILIDGSIVTNLPVSVALARGADRVWAIYIRGSDPEKMPVDNVFSTSLRVIMQSMTRQVEHEIELLRKTSGRLITVSGYDELRPWDYEHTAQMIQSGYYQAIEQLDGLDADGQ